MLQINIVEKKFGNKIILQNLNFSIEKNGLYGIVGKNGSGKTTFFKCLSHLTNFQGTILFKRNKISLENIAFIPTEPYLYEHLSVKEFYSFYAKMLDIPVKTEMIFDVDNSLLIRELSTGMRKKIYINAVFQKEYDIYVFDEPFNGLDIESVYELRKIIIQLSENKIVFISSHLLESLNRCEYIFVLNNSKLEKINKENYNDLENIIFGDKSK